MLGYMQNILDDVRDKKLIEEWQRTSTSSTTTASPPIAIEEDADLSVNTQITKNSEETSIDQSNNGFSFINIHWASFLTGLSSVLAVVIVFILISGCCYLRAPPRATPRCLGTSSPVLTATAAPLHVSSQGPTQASSSEDVIRAGPFIFELVRGAVSAPSVHYSASPASYGLPGYCTKYTNSPALQHFPSTPRLAISHELHSSHPKAIEFHQEGRSTGIHSLSR